MRYILPLPATTDAAPPDVAIALLRHFVLSHNEIVFSALHQKSYVVPLVVLLTAGTAAAQVPVREISIRSGWNGLGTPQNAVTTVRVKSGILTYDGKRVDRSKVDALIAALRSSPVSKPDPSNLGVTPAWLNEKMGDKKGRFQLESARGTANQRALLAETYTDPEQIAHILPALFSFVRTDDYPIASIDVTFDDGTHLKAETRSYYPFMLPWTVGEQGQQTYNADISRAVANLLVRKSPNRERLAGGPLADELAQAVKRSIEKEWNLVGSHDRAGDALTLLRSRYEIVASEIHPYHRLEYGTATNKGEPEQVNLHATLRKPAFPPSVSVALVLEQVQGRVQGVDTFIGNAEKYENLALSVPWLNEYMQAHPGVPIRISYVHDRSLGEKAMRSFTDDMRFREHPELIQQVRAQQGQLVLLIVGNPYAGVIKFALRQRLSSRSAARQ